MDDSFLPADGGLDGFAARLEDGLGASEQAVLALGEVIQRIVGLATGSVAGRGAGAGGAEPAFAERLERLASASAGFIAETRAFLRSQVDFARSANAAFGTIHKSATGVSDLTVKSRLLALNLRIEAGRGHGEGGALQVVGKEMVQLSNDIRTASDAIVRALAGLSGSLPQLESGALSMDDRANRFAAALGGQIESIRGDVGALREAQAEHLRRVEDRNRAVVGLAHQAMSELQFHDPLVQNVRAAIGVLRGDLEDASGTPVARSALGDTDLGRKAGDVDLF